MDDQPPTATPPPGEQPTPAAGDAAEPATNPLRLVPGEEVMPGYRLVRLLGVGGFGEVWEARAPGDFPVALKFIRLATRQASLELRGLGVLRTVRHPHLIDVHWAVPVGDRLVIAMPLCDRSLMDRLGQCQASGLPGIPRAEMLGYLADIAVAVDFLNTPRHRAADGSRFSVQHRDIKPHNIFLVSGSARLADFGLAKIIADSRAYHSGPLSVFYAPPEFFLDRVSATSDQYSLAVTYIELCSGRLPFTGTVHSVVHNILSGEPDLEYFEPAERAVLARALAKDAHQRFPSCQAFVRALRELAEAPPTTSKPRTQCLLDLLGDVRNRTLKVMLACPTAELTWAPRGTSNHVLWHAGHVLWVQDSLCIQVCTGRSELPTGWADAFGMNSRPAEHFWPWPKPEEVFGHLKAQRVRLRTLIGGIADPQLDILPPFPHLCDRRTLGQCILHGLHDEAAHQGEMYLLVKMLRLA